MDSQETIGAAPVTDVSADSSDAESAREPPRSLIRVAIVDETPHEAVSTAALLDTEPDLSVIGTGVSGADALSLAKELRPEVLMLDLSLPDADGHSVTRSIVEAGPGSPAVLAVTNRIDESLALEAFGAGAVGVCSKEDSSQVVIQSIRSVGSGELTVSPSILRGFLRRLARPRAHLRACSSREVEVLALVGEGATNDEIAEQLYIAPTTVRSHVQNLRMKLGARDRVGLVVVAHESGLMEPGAVPKSEE